MTEAAGARRPYLLIGEGERAASLARALATRGDVRWLGAEADAAAHADCRALDPCDAAALAAALAGDGPLAALVLCPAAPRSTALRGAFATYRATLERALVGSASALRLADARLGPGSAVVLVAPEPPERDEPLSCALPIRWGLEALWGSARAELGPRGVRVHGVAPESARRPLSSDELAQEVLAALDRERAQWLCPPRAGRGSHALERLWPAAADRRAGAARRGPKPPAPRSALITGASRGLGRELARLYAAELEELHLAARGEAALRELASELAAHAGCSVSIWPVDLADPEACDRFASALPDVELLVLNAGVHATESLAESEPRSHARLLHTNFLASARLAASLIDRKTPPRKIVSILSTSAIAGRRRRSAYAVAKAAAWALVRSLRRALPATQVLEVMPSTFDSRPAAAVAPDERQWQKARALGRTWHADAIAAAIRDAERAGRQRLYVPLEVRAFLVLEAVAPRLFARLFP